MKLAASFLTVQVVFLLALQVCALVVLWSINPLTQAATDAFALFLSMDVLAAAVVSYTYRSFRHGSTPSEAWMSAGYLALAVLILSILAIR